MIHMEPFFFEAFVLPFVLAAVAFYLIATVD